MDDRGRETFRLEQLAPANGYNHDGAHEALADVEATIYMTRLIREREPEIWNALDRATTKNAVRDQVADQSMFRPDGSDILGGPIHGWSRPAGRIRSTMANSQSLISTTIPTIIATFPLKRWSVCSRPTPR